MIANYGAFASGLCWLVAAVQYGYNGNWRMIIVSLAYATATMALIGAR
jgi:hypothetical protein